MHAAWVVDIRLNFDITRTTLLWTCGCNIFFNAEICAFPSRARASWYLRYKLAPKVELSKSNKTWTQQDLFILSEKKRQALFRSVHVGKSDWSLLNLLWLASEQSAASPAGCNLSSQAASHASGGKNAVEEQRPWAAFEQLLQIQKSLADV